MNDQLRSQKDEEYKAIKPRDLPQDHLIQLHSLASNK
jgi:hypothetical protein